MCTLPFLKCPVPNVTTMPAILTIDTFFTNLLIGCYEAKVEESEKAGSHWESNPGHLWLEPPVLCQWPTDPRQLDNHQLSQSSICTAQVVLNASVTHLAATQLGVHLSSFTFLYFRLITSKFMYFQHEASTFLLMFV